MKVYSNTYYKKLKNGGGHMSLKTALFIAFCGLLFSLYVGILIRLVRHKIFKRILLNAFILTGSFILFPFMIPLAIFRMKEKIIQQTITRIIEDTDNPTTKKNLANKSSKLYKETYQSIKPKILSPGFLIKTSIGITATGLMRYDDILTNVIQSYRDKHLDNMFENKHKHSDTKATKNPIFFPSAAIISFVTEQIGNSLQDTLVGNHFS